MAVKESYAGKINRKLTKKLRVIAVAAGREKADLVLKNATYVNVFSNELCHGDIAVAEGLIVGMGEYSGNTEVDMGGKIVLPGFVDAHIHLESSLVSPTEFAKAVLPHGTTTVITDPHEIANVMGTDGIEYMLQATEDLPVDVRFMLPSCVPATPLDESGANLDYRAIDSFYDHPRVQGLAEMMNFVGTINGDPQVVEKIVASQAHHKKIDGHAPDLVGNDLNAYIAAGVYSDHECHDLNDAIAKLQRGQFIMIREGTAARNLEALVPLLCDKYVERCMFCTDDKHPNDLLEKGHIDYIVKKAIALGADPITAIKAACHNAARYFLLNNRGAIAPGYLGDFVIIDDFTHFNIEKVFKKGELMYSDGVLKEFPTPEIDLGVVRGLDYYTGMVFEAEAPALGAEKQICGGGSYTLSELFGGEKVFSTGFAIGFDRALLALEKEGAVYERRGIDAYVLCASDDVRLKAAAIAADLRAAGISADQDIMDRKMAKAMKSASFARYSAEYQKKYTL